MAQNEYGMKKIKNPEVWMYVPNFSDVREVEYRAAGHFTSKIVTPQLKKNIFFKPFWNTYYHSNITYTYHEFISSPVKMQDEMRKGGHLVKILKNCNSCTCCLLDKWLKSVMINGFLCKRRKLRFVQLSFHSGCFGKIQSYWTFDPLLQQSGGSRASEFTRENNISK